MQRLGRWALDPATHVIAVTGLGGIGKTALVSSWMKQAGSELAGRYRHGLFWSFYADPNPDALFEHLVEVGVRHLRFEVNDRHELSVQAADLVREASLLVIIDGVEVLQETEGNPRYGSLISQPLKQLLLGFLQSEGSLAVATSRFPIADLDPHLGDAARWLSLEGLPAQQSGLLLAALGVTGTPSQLADAGEALGGHALGLRVLASAAQVGGSIANVLSVLAAVEGHSLERKLVRLVDYYVTRATHSHRRALEILSLFRTPVDISTVERLWTLGRKDASSGGSEAQDAVEALVASGLCTREGSPREGTFSCHPVLRDTIRLTFLRSERELVGSAIGLLTSQPQTAAGASEFSAIHDAIVLLLQVGQTDRALRLIQTRFGSGAIYLERPGIVEAMEVLSLVLLGENWRRIRRTQSLARLEELAEFFSYVSEAARLYGDSALATRGIQAFDAITAKLDGMDGDLDPLIQFRSDYSRFGQSISRAEWSSASRAIPTAEFAPAWHAHLLSLRSRFDDADREFERAREGGMGELRDEDLLGELSGPEAVWWTEHLLATDRHSLAVDVAESNETICGREPDATVWCRSLSVLSLSLAVEARLVADDALRSATKSSQFQYYLEARLILTFQELMSGGYAPARAGVDEVVASSRSRTWRLLFIDALDLRGELASRTSAPDAVIEDDRLQSDALAQRVGYRRRLMRKLASTAPVA